MTKYEQLENLIINSNGYFIVSDAIESGVSKQYVYDFVKNKNL